MDQQQQQDSQKGKMRGMQWKFDHDVMLIREVLLFEPWLHRQGSVERGSVWKRIAESLNSLENPKFKVDDRSVRDHINLLIKKFRKKESDEKKASGIAPEEETEIDQGLRDIIEQFKESDEQFQLEVERKKQKLDSESAQAEELRRESLETFGETKKRKSLDDEDSGGKKKRRSSGSETISYLKEKNCSEIELRKEELALKKKELEERQKNQNQMQQFLIGQQNQTTQMMQQQQQMNVAFMQIMSKFIQK